MLLLESANLNNIYRPINMKKSSRPTIDLNVTEANICKLPPVKA